MNKNGQSTLVSKSIIAIIFLAIVIISVNNTAYNRGYDEGFLEANKSYTSCLERLDSNLNYYQTLLGEKEKDLNFWKEEYLKCNEKDPKVIVFPIVVFNEIVYNVLIIGLWIFLSFNLFKGTVKISLSKKIDGWVEKNQQFVSFFKFIIWASLLVLSLFEISKLISNFI